MPGIPEPSDEEKKQAEKDVKDWLEKNDYPTPNPDPKKK
jgi:hypothetical protein